VSDLGPFTDQRRRSYCLRRGHDPGSALRDSKDVVPLDPNPPCTWLYRGSQRDSENGSVWISHSVIAMKIRWSERSSSPCEHGDWDAVRNPTSDYGTRTYGH
jgi:hypothetical protein